MSAAGAIRERIAHPVPATYLAVGVGVAALVFAAFGLVLGQTASGRQVRVFGAADRGSVLRCVHSLGLSAVLGPTRESVMGDWSQRLVVDASQGRFEPNHLLARAGVPIEVLVSQGSGCTERIVFDEPAADATLIRGSTTLRLPPLESGMYPFRCSQGTIAGLLVVR